MKKALEPGVRGLAAVSPKRDLESLYPVPLMRAKCREQGFCPGDGRRDQILQTNEVMRWM